MLRQSGACLKQGTVFWMEALSLLSEARVSLLGVNSAKKNEKNKMVSSSFLLAFFICLFVFSECRSCQPCA